MATNNQIILNEVEALQTLESKIVFARKYSALLANVICKLSVKPIDRSCFAVILYSPILEFETPTFPVSSVSGDWDGSSVLINQGHFRFVKRPSYSLKPILKEVARALDVNMISVPDADSFVCTFPTLVYPCLRAVVSKNGDIKYSSITHLDEVTIMFSFEKTFNHVRKLMLSGDVELNPGPFSPMCVEELVKDSYRRHRCFMTVAAPSSRSNMFHKMKMDHMTLTPFRMVKMSDRDDKLIYFWSAVKTLNYKISKLPRIQTCIDYLPAVSNSLSSFKVTPKKTDKTMMGVKNNGVVVKPVVIRTTPFDDAVRTLTTSTKGVWTIPFYKVNSASILKQFVQKYTRKDGKQINIRVNFVLKEMCRYTKERAIVTDLCHLQSEYFSYVWSLVFSEVVARAKMACLYDDVWDSTWMIFFNNFLVSNILSNYNSNYIDFYALVCETDYSVCNFLHLDGSPYKSDMVKTLLMAPIRSSVFNYWAETVDYRKLVGRGTELTSIRMHEYGLGASISYGVFRSPDFVSHFKSYFLAYDSFVAFLPCIEQDFISLAQELASLWTDGFREPDYMNSDRVTYGQVHVLRAAYTYGVFYEVYANPMCDYAINVCPACYQNFLFRIVDDHCFNSTNKSLKRFMAQFTVLESVFNYWMQLILGIAEPTWNSFFYYALLEPNSVAQTILRSRVEVLPSMETMDTAGDAPFFARMIGLGPAVQNLSQTHREVTSQLDATRNILEGVQTGDIVNRTSQILSRIENAMPLFEGDAPISSYLEILDGWLCKQVVKAVKLVYPIFEESHMPPVRISLVLRDFVIAKHVDNKIIKSLIFLDMLKQAGLFSVVDKFFKGFTRFSEETSKTTSFSSITDWITELLSSPADWCDYVVTFISGFVSLMWDKFNPAHLMKYITNIAPSFRNIASIGSGLNAISNIFSFVSRCYYLAKEYVCGALGVKCNIPVYVHLKEHLTNWIAAVNTLCMPNHRNTIIATDETWPIIDEIEKVGRDILKHAPSGPLNSLALNTFKELLKLRSQITWKKGMSASVFVPFVVHINGPPNIGKSCAWSAIVPLLANTMGIKPNVYMYNEITKWFDGYQQEEIIIVDDVNLSKEAESILWLIKLVSPNICYLPTAENETRPLVSNCKLIILTSNTPYSPVTGVATTAGIDRRSTYKFDVKAEHYNQETKKIDSTKVVSWDEELTFTRIPSVIDGKLVETEKFEGKMLPFTTYVCQEALKHMKAEKARLHTNGGDVRVIGENAALQKLLFDGLDAGSSAVDLEMLRNQIKTINFSSHQAFMERLVTIETTNDPLTVEEVASIDSMILNYRNKVTCREALDKGLQLARTAFSYPKYDTDKIVFTESYPSTLPDMLNTSYLCDSPFIFGCHRLDPYFLTHLYMDNDRFIINSFYKRNLFKHHFVRPDSSLFDYHSYETLIQDSSFMDSHKLFFSLSDNERACCFARWSVSMATHAILERNRTSVWATVSGIIAGLGSQEALQKYAIGALVSFFIIGSVAVVIEALTDVLVTNVMQRNLDTSNAPRPVKMKPGVVSRVTSSHGYSDVGFDNIKDKVLRNLYLAKFCDYKGQSLGTFNILFIHERYAIIPHHAIRGKQLQTAAEDQGLLCIYIWCDIHCQFLRYNFTKEFTYRLPNKDAFILHIPQFRSQRTLLNAWTETLLTEEDHGSSIETVFKDARGTKTICSNYRNTSEVISSGNTGALNTYHSQYNTTVSMPPGSSGGFALIDNTKFQSKLIGIQSGTMFINGAHVQAIARHELSDAIQLLNSLKSRSVSIPTCDVPYTPLFDPEHPTLIGVVDKANAVTVSPKTQIKNTPWQGKLVQIPEREPVFRTTARDDLYNYVDKTEDTALKPFNVKDLNDAVRDYAEILRLDLKRNGITHPIGNLSMQAAVSGGYIGGKPIDVKSSPGVGIGNWIKNREGPGQTDFIQQTDEVQYPTEKLKEIVTQLFVDVMHGTSKTSTYASFPKDELRPFLKDARGIDGAPIEQKVLYRMLFGRLDGLLSNINSGQLKYGLGINLFSADGTRLISRMTDQVCAWDFSKFDGSITYQMYEAVVSLYNILSHHDEHSVTRHNLAYMTCHSTIIADDKVYQPNKGMRSGFGGTSSFNTHIHNLFIILAVKSLLKSKELLSPTIYDVLRVVDWITYGDDGLAWIKDPTMSEVINGETIAMKFEEFGLKVADPRGKHSLPPKFIPITEATFLKQSPYFDEHLLLPIWRVQEDCLQSVFNYYSGSEPYTPLDSAFHMLWPYGPERYESIRSKLNVILDKSDKTYVKTWYAYLEDFRLSFEDAIFTGEAAYFVRCYQVRSLVGDTDDVF
nr:MAG: RNA-dependent RNA polymerase [Myotis brandtii picorna-like virus 1]